MSENNFFVPLSLFRASHVGRRSSASCRRIAPASFINHTRAGALDSSKAQRWRRCHHHAWHQPARFDPKVPTIQMNLAFMRSSKQVLSRFSEGGRYPRPFACQNFGNFGFSGVKSLSHESPRRLSPQNRHLAPLNRFGLILAIQVRVKPAAPSSFFFTLLRGSLRPKDLH